MKKNSLNYSLYIVAIFTFIFIDGFKATAQTWNTFNTNQMILKKMYLFFMIFVLLINSGCKKEDLTDEIDITQYTWKITTITTGGNKEKASKENNFGDDITYYLIFQSDTTFNLNTSVNSGGGSYELLTKGVINVFLFEEYTEKGGHNNFDRILLGILPKVVSYQVLDETLLLKGENSEIELKKK